MTMTRYKGSLSGSACPAGIPSLLIEVKGVNGLCNKYHLRNSWER